MTAPGWIASLVGDFGKAAGLASLSLNGQGTAAIAFENGFGLRFEYVEGELVVAVTVPVFLDVGRTKALLSYAHHEARLGFRPEFTFTSGADFPQELSEYALIIHCGGCTLPEREVQRRLQEAGKAAVPMTNYGVAIAHLHGILARSLSPFTAGAAADFTCADAENAVQYKL